MFIWIATFTSLLLSQMTEASRCYAHYHHENGTCSGGRISHPQNTDAPLDYLECCTREGAKGWQAKNTGGVCIKCRDIVDGGWGAWSTWSGCTGDTCDGTKTRRRVCDTPSPRHGGQKCAGDSGDTKPCKGCSDFTWSTWSSWSGCSVSCGAGHRIRKRTCLKTDDVFKNKHGVSKTTNDITVDVIREQSAWLCKGGYAKERSYCPGVGLCKEVLITDDEDLEIGGSGSDNNVMVTKDDVINKNKHGSTVVVDINTPNKSRPLHKNNFKTISDDEDDFAEGSGSGDDLNDDDVSNDDASNNDDVTNIFHKKVKVIEHLRGRLVARSPTRSLRKKNKNSRLWRVYYNLSHWTPWSGCSAKKCSDGLGQQTRKRQCKLRLTNRQSHPSKCHVTSDAQTRTCISQSCTPRDLSRILPVWKLKQARVSINQHHGQTHHDLLEPYFFKDKALKKANYL